MSLSVVYNQFQLPKKIQVTKQGENHAQFVAEPLERGFGHTMGNTLRRMLLSSLEAPAIVSFWMEDVSHEYMTVEGIVEGIAFISLNLKKAKLRNLMGKQQMKPNRTFIFTTTVCVTEADIKKANGQFPVRLGDFFQIDEFPLVNPEDILFHVTKPMKKEVGIRVGVDRGYIPSDMHQVKDRRSDEIFIDSMFSPVTLVNYYVENTRVGQSTDYDRLILDVTTDGRVTPEEALTLAAQIGNSYLDVFSDKEFLTLTFEEEQEDDDAARDELFRKLALKITEIELSVRSENCLKSADIGTIGELVTRDENEMLECKNFGKKSLEEINNKLCEMSLSLGMDLSRYGLTSENVIEVVKEYQEGKNSQVVIE